MASSSSAASDWLKQDERRMLHAVYRVGDMDATVKYYTDLFGMKLLRFRDIPDEKCVSGVFLGVEGGGASRRSQHAARHSHTPTHTPNQKVLQRLPRLRP